MAVANPKITHTHMPHPVHLFLSLTLICVFVVNVGMVNHEGTCEGQRLTSTIFLIVLHLFFF